MEKAYFPMEVLNISQGYGQGTYSHKYNMALDISGKDTGIDLAYAPYTGTIKKTYNSDHQIWFASNNKVLCADGKERYLVMLLAHNNNLDLKVGQVIKQGAVFYKEGTYAASSNITGNHIHMELGEGPFSGTGWFLNTNGVWQINKPIAPEKMLWLKEGTKIRNTVSNNKDYMMKMDENKVVEEEKPTITEDNPSDVNEIDDTELKDNFFQILFKKIISFFEKLLNKNKM